MNLSLKALNFATERHGGQLRRYDGTPYTMHLYRVGELVKTVPYSDEMLAVAYLHDTLEDTNTTLSEIRDNFGSRLLLLVNALTDRRTPADGPRRLRKLEHAIKLGSVPTSHGFSRIVHTVKVADLIDNADSIVRQDPKFAPVFMSEMLYLIDGPFLKFADNILRMKAWHVLDSYQAYIRQNLP